MSTQYERRMSFSLLRGLLGTVVPALIAYLLYTIYFASVEEYSAQQATSAARDQLRFWYIAYPGYVFVAHLFLFALAVGYRRRIVNWWAQLVWLAGIFTVVTLVYYSVHPETQTPFSDSFSLIHSPTTSPRGIAIQQPSDGVDDRGPSTRSRPNLLSAVNPLDVPSPTTVSRDSDGAYKVRAVVGDSSVTFEISPESDITTIGYERLRDFAHLSCIPGRYYTTAGFLEGCTVTLPELQIDSMKLRNVQAAFISSQSGYSFLGANVLSRIGYTRNSDSITLGRPGAK